MYLSPVTCSLVPLAKPQNLQFIQVVFSASSLTSLAYSPSILGSSHATYELTLLCQPFSWRLASVGPTLGKIALLTPNPVAPMEKCSPSLFVAADKSIYTYFQASQVVL
ncbi:transmembrane protein 129 [Platysternon megacephalum]|uniref:Transmembrane protein 129 n=1 Tax=Platysternon megacephalum TaxID=55544 RepID=A0A4D9EJQ2_9SAUR|nr:transmembrane protein 129 [Platysternon megacephalum]